MTAKPLKKSCLDIRRLRFKLKKVLLEMHAVVDIAGQQFKVEAGNEIFVQRLPQAKGESVEFGKVLLVGNDEGVKVGTPYLDGAVVKATVLDDSARADKVLVFKKIRRKGFQKLNGHRQKLSKIQINEIV